MNEIAATMHDPDNLVFSTGVGHVERAYENDVKVAVQHVVNHLGDTEQGFHRWEGVEEYVNESVATYPAEEHNPRWIVAASPKGNRIKMGDFIDQKGEVRWSDVAGLCYSQDLYDGLAHAGITPAAFVEENEIVVHVFDHNPTAMQYVADDVAKFAAQGKLRVSKTAILPPMWIRCMGKSVETIDLNDVPARRREEAMRAADRLKVPTILNRPYPSPIAAP